MKRHLRRIALEVFNAVRNRKKPIVGAISGLISYIAARIGLELDPEASAAIAGAIFALVVERAYPVFGAKATTPQVV